MITKEMLESLKAGRELPTLYLDLTPGGSIEQSINSQLDAARERDINLAERAFRDAGRSMRIEQAVSSHHGLSKAHFNSPKPELKP